MSGIPTSAIIDTMVIPKPIQRVSTPAIPSIPSIKLNKFINQIQSIAIKKHSRGNGINPFVTVSNGTKNITIATVIA